MGVIVVSSKSVEGIDHLRTVVCAEQSAACHQQVGSCLDALRTGHSVVDAAVYGEVRSQTSPVALGPNRAQLVQGRGEEGLAAPAGLLRGYPA